MSVGKKRVLFLTQVLPYPLDAGPKVRAYYVLRHLSQRFDVTLASFVRPTDTEAAMAHLRTFCRSVHTVQMARSRPRDAANLVISLLSGSPFVIVRDRVPDMIKLVQALARSGDFDFVHADQLWMAQYALAFRNAPGGQSVRLVLDQHNAVFQMLQRMAQHESNPLKRALLDLERRKLARFEAGACRAFDKVVWVTEEDREAVGRAGGAAMGGPVIPICGNAEATIPLVRKSGARRVTFLGGLHYPPNAQGMLWFFREVWPMVVRQAPEVVLTVIGKDPPAELRGWSGSGGSVEVTGYLADPLPFLEETAAFTVPLLAGGGMRVKIVDAWMWGLPVVSTTIGAEGIERVNGENILLVDTPADFAQAVVGLLRDPAEGERLGQSGRRWAQERYDWRTAYGAWDAVYDEV